MKLYQNIFYMGVVQSCGMIWGRGEDDNCNISALWVELIFISNKFLDGRTGRKQKAVCHP